MDNISFTDLRIDIVNIMDAVILIAKHRIGEVSDEEYKCRLDNLESMFKTAKKMVARTAIDELFDILNKRDRKDEA